MEIRQSKRRLYTKAGNQDKEQELRMKMIWPLTPSNCSESHATREPRQGSVMKYGIDLVDDAINLQ